VPVDDLLGAPDSSKWSEFSIEFCGGTHLTNTAQAEAFVLLQEEGVARGVRRITATTGALAKEALALGAALSARVAKAKALSGAAFDDELSALKQEVPTAVVPLVVKRQLQAGVAELAAAANDAAKAGAKALGEAAKAEGAALGGAHKASPFFVALLETEADGKAVDAAAIAFKAEAPDTVSDARRDGRHAAGRDRATRGSRAAADARSTFAPSLAPLAALPCPPLARPPACPAAFPALLSLLLSFLSGGDPRRREQGRAQCDRTRARRRCRQGPLRKGLARGGARADQRQGRRQREPLAGRVAGGQGRATLRRDGKQARGSQAQLGAQVQRAGAARAGRCGTSSVRASAQRRGRRRQISSRHSHEEQT
jgi:hypothetical protein